MSDGVVNLSNAPRHTEFGEATDHPDETAGSLIDSGTEVVTKLPGGNNLNNIRKNFSQATDLQPLFEGERTLDEALEQFQQLLQLATDANLVVDAAWGIGSSAMEGEAPWSFIVSTLAGARLDFMVAYFQPFQDMVGVFTGNQERIEVSGLMWDRTGESLSEIGEEVGKIALTEMDPYWTGEACAAAGKRLGEFQDVLAVCARLSAGVGKLMELTGDFAGRVFSRYRQMMIDSVNNVIECADALKSPNPVTVAKALLTVLIQLQRTILECVQMAIQAARIYLQAGQLLMDINRVFEEAVPFLEWAAEPLGCEPDIRV